jgi:hypothetical protein
MHQESSSFSSDADAAAGEQITDFLVKLLGNAAA